MKITNVAIDQKTSVFVLLGIIVIAGLTAYSNLPLESFPDIKQPMVFVAVPYPGVSPADMETLVAQPIEDKLKELPKIKKLTSSSKEGYTSVFAEFEPNVETDEAVRKVREKVDLAKPELPRDLEDPIVQEINFENIPIVLVSISGNQSLVRLKKIAEDLQDEFKEIPGVLDVTLSGGLTREVKVNINPNRLTYYNIGVDDVIEAIRDENMTIPGGSTESQDLKWTVRVPGEFKSVEELRNIVVKSKNGFPIHLYDLAEVYFGFKDHTSFSRLNGNPSVTLGIQKRSGENIIAITDEAKKILAAAKENFPARTDYVIVMDQSEDIRIFVNELENNILAGLILVVMVLYFFMGTRNGLLVGIAIPLTMLVSYIVISFMGYTLNMMVLFSLILALGMMVDNAIVILENIYRHLEEGKSLVQASKDGTAEVGMAVIVSTATTLLAFLPMIFWDDIMGEFMKFIPITLMITLTCSLFVGLVLNPVIASSFMKIDKNMDKLPGERLLKRLTRQYEKMLHWSLNHRFSTLGIVIMLYFGMIFVYGTFGKGIEFFPTVEPRQIIVDVETPLGSRVETSDKIVSNLEQIIKDTPDLENYVADVGNVSEAAEMGGDGGSGLSHKSRLTLDLLDKFDREQASFLTMEQVRDAVAMVPGATIDVSGPQEGPPTGKPVEIQLKGEDFKVLSSLSAAMMKKIEDIPNITKLKDNYDRGKPELQIRIDRKKAALFGLKTSKIANTIRTAVNGTEASEYRVGTDEYEITVRFSKDFRESYTDLLNLTIFHEGTHYPLANFATIELASGLSSVNHVEGDRVITISAESIGDNDNIVLEECKARLADFELPVGYTMTFAGQNKEQQKSMDFLARAFLIAILLIFLLLVTEFNSVTLPFVIMMSVLLSFFGVFFGLTVTQRPYGIIMTSIGIISLAGVVVNNAIVLIDYIQKLRERGLSKYDAIVEGGKVRLRPVILTAITTILGLIPLTLGINIDIIGLLQGDVSQFIQFGVESAQWWSGMGIVVIFGLLFATLLTLIVVPVMYHLLSDIMTDIGFKFSRSRKGKKRADERSDPGISGAPQKA